MNATTLYLQELIDAGAGTTVILPDGLFIIDQRLTLSTNNVTIKSAGSTIIQSIEPIIIWVTADLVNVNFEGVTFKSSGIGANVEGYYGLFTSDKKSIDGLTFSQCTFTAPEIITNGIKLIADAAGVMVKNVLIKDCVFEGRMGVEIQSFFDETERLFSCIVKDCTFQNLGLGNGGVDAGGAPQHWGQAVSIAGRGRDHIIDNNKIDNPYAIAIELTGGMPNCQITNNTFVNCIRNWSEQNLKMSLISLDAISRQGINENCTIHNNKCLDQLPRTTVFFDQLVNCTISDNVLPVESWITIQRADGNIFTRNVFVAYGLYCLFMDSVAGSITNNLFENNTIKNSVYNYGSVYLKGLHAKDNLFRGGSITGMNPFTQVSGAAKNYVQNVSVNGQQTTTAPSGSVFIIPTITNGVPAGFGLYNTNQPQPTAPTDYAYGAQGKYSYIFGYTDPLVFNDSTFGDPIPGVAKQVYSRPATNNPVYDAQGTPDGFTQATGNLPAGPKHLAYGTDRKFVFRFNVQPNDIPPLDGTFGDAAPGYPKAGYYENE